MRSTVPAVALSILAAVVVPVHAESKPGYCAELLPYAGYTFSEEVLLSNQGLVYVSTTAGELSLGQRLAATDFEMIQLVKDRATETYLARKGDQVYLIAQIDMGAPEPFCSRQALN